MKGGEKVKEFAAAAAARATTTTTTSLFAISQAVQIIFC